MEIRSIAVTFWLALSSHLIDGADSNLCRDSCDVDFRTIGCYIDRPPPNRALPFYIYNERDPSLSNYGGRLIDWYNWNEYFPGFACRCAMKARDLGYDLFGLQFYGECWAGHSLTDDHSAYGEDLGGCLQDDYQMCGAETRYCMGKKWRNMVYQIVDTTCPYVSYEKVGCFRDRHNIVARPLPDYLFNDRDNSIPNFSGQWIDWKNWDLFVPSFACRCAQRAKELNHTFFGMQYYGECWSGPEGHLTYFRDGMRNMGCIDQCNEPCKTHSKFCSGKNFANYVYRIVDGTCEVDVTPVGCYNEASKKLLNDVFYNEADPQQPNYGGQMIQWGDNYDADFPSLLCKCARIAMQKRWEYFGVREIGLCVRNKRNAAVFAKHGISDQCFEGHDSRPCNDSKLCGAMTTEANFVYRITLPIHGGFSSWGNWSECSASCGGGSRTRSRECNNPVPQKGGFDCASIGPYQESELCNEFACSEPANTTLSAPLEDDVAQLADDTGIRRSLRKIIRNRKNF